ncbi:hypothetical protein Peur_047080 [Populus x canadensis]
MSWTHGLLVPVGSPRSSAARYIFHEQPKKTSYLKMLKRTGRNFSWPSAGNASSWLRYVEAVDMMSCLSILNWGISKLFIPAFRSFQ